MIRLLAFTKKIRTLISIQLYSLEINRIFNGNLTDYHSNVFH